MATKRVKKDSLKVGDTVAPKIVEVKSCQPEIKVFGFAKTRTEERQLDPDRLNEKLMGGHVWLALVLPGTEYFRTKGRAVVKALSFNRPITVLWKECGENGKSDIIAIEGDSPKTANPADVLKAIFDSLVAISHDPTAISFQHRVPSATATNRDTDARYYIDPRVRHLLDPAGELRDNQHPRQFRVTRREDGVSVVHVAVFSDPAFKRPMEKVVMAEGQAPREVAATWLGYLSLPAVFGEKDGELGTCEGPIHCEAERIFVWGAKCDRVPGGKTIVTESVDDFVKQTGTAPSFILGHNEDGKGGIAGTLRQIARKVAENEAREAERHKRETVERDRRVGIAAARATNALEGLDFGFDSAGDAEDVG